MSPRRPGPLTQFLSCGVLAIAGSWGGDVVPAAAGEIQAGVARETFTLPKHVPLAGYSRRQGKPSQGVHDPVGVRALVLRDGPTTVALVSCDLLIVDEHLYQAVRHRLLGGGMPQDTVLIVAATHTHSGP